MTILYSSLHRNFVHATLPFHIDHHSLESAIHITHLLCTYTAICDSYGSFFPFFFCFFLSPLCLQSTLRYLPRHRNGNGFTPPRLCSILGKRSTSAPGSFLLLPYPFSLLHSLSFTSSGGIKGMLEKRHWRGRWTMRL